MNFNGIALGKEQLILKVKKWYILNF